MRQKTEIYSKKRHFMTVRGRYNESMKNCLLSVPLSGAFWLIFLFILCFFGVHVVRLAKIGWKYQTRRGEPAPTNSQMRSRLQTLRPNPSTISWNASANAPEKPIPRPKKLNSNDRAAMKNGSVSFFSKRLKSSRRFRLS